MNENSYAGREYLSSLKKEDIKIDAISIGTYPKYDIVEENRCGGLWKPEQQEILSKFHNFFTFDSLNSKGLIQLLKKNEYQLGIQGGTGIITKKIFEKFKLGILNFHPGLLPYYRGCSAPEWQVYEDQPVYSTCHLIDEGIDSGKIVEIKKINTKMTSYEHFRASIYIETSKFLIQIIKEIISLKGFKMKLKHQNQEEAVYRKFIGDKKLNYIKKNCFNKNLS